MESPSIEIRRAFGFLFICVSIAVVAGAVLSEIVYQNNLPFYYYGIVWVGSFGITVGSSFRKFSKTIPLIRQRMKNSVKWPPYISAINGLCWAGPFAAIAVFPSLLQYLILLGIGLGNLATYLMMRKFSNQDNREQMIVGCIALISIPVAVFIDTQLVILQDVAVLLSRILIAISYAAGGIYARR
ncbi:hypothetical protein QVH35_08955 [Candidatus Nitrosotenuis chungbukensis]|uniref:hypothetical protein n=1 Tax=Candidatus Nitrosotenuis chungbukensis TaxID=1353246 RepID=UPI0005B2A5E9|nr:hypothetical protein [Candidatus Nitrosotenuis chungbukensis]WKT57495.1 hypothetical protein QVH35_08955 [Candidatus Nitrosotenuis chungbukensis]